MGEPARAVQVRVRLGAACKGMVIVVADAYIFPPSLTSIPPSPPPSSHTGRSGAPSSPPHYQPHQQQQQQP